MLLNRVKALLTDDMLDLTSILSGNLLIHAQLYEPCGEKLMPFINHFSDFTA